MKIFCLTVIELLDSTPNEIWAEVFIKFRIEFFHRYQRGLVTSTIHGIDFFKNVLNCLNGMKWEEKGEYGDNFRELIKRNWQ